jgi:hypothetical protein
LPSITDLSRIHKFHEICGPNHATLRRIEHNLPHQQL